MNRDWRDPDAAWWAKAARARHHIEDVSHQVSACNPASAYEIVPEPRPDTGDDSHATDLRLKVLRKPPTGLLTTTGDALHHLRSCLDSVAFELAMRHTGGTITEKQQRAVQFPLSMDRAAFDGTLLSDSLRDLFGDNERAALRTAQPFALREDASAAGVTFPRQTARNSTSTSCAGSAASTTWTSTDTCLCSRGTSTSHTSPRWCRRRRCTPADMCPSATVT